MDNRHVDGLSQATDAQYSASLPTPVKLHSAILDDSRVVACPPCGSPISGLCSGAAAGIGTFISPTFISPTPAGSSRSNPAERHLRDHGSGLRTGPLHLLHPLRAAAGPSPKQSSTLPLSWTPGSNVLNISTHSMPELWQNTVPAPGSVQYARDSSQLRDQGGINTVTHPLLGWGAQPTSAEAQQVQQHMQQQQPHLSASMPSLSVPASQQPEDSSWPVKQQVSVQQGHDQPAGNTWSRRQSMQGQHELQSCGSLCSAQPATAANQQTATGKSSLQCVPIDVLLSPLLPSADEGKLLDRLSQLRAALDEQRRLAASWEQQAIMLQQAVTEGQQEGLALRGQLVSLQQNIHLLGGNLQGRLSLVQGAVLAQMQTQIAEKDAAVAASEAQIAAFQAHLSRLSSGFEAKLAAEQTERERLGAEAAQARLLCMARGRQLSNLQQELQQLQDKAKQHQQGAAASANLQQQQLESLRQQLQDVQQQLEQARGAAADAVQQASAAEGAKAGLRQQVDELTSVLAEKQLQIEWLEGKVADLEGNDLNQQFKRHSVEISRLQQAAAVERQTLEQQLAAAQQELAQLQQAGSQQQQRLEAVAQSNTQLQQQLKQQQESAAQQVQQLEQQLQQAEGEVQQLQVELEAVQLQLQQESQQQQQPAGFESGDSQQSMTAFAAAGGPAAADAAAVAQEAGDSDQHFDRELCEESEVPSHGPSRCPSDAASAAEHALRAQLGMANAEVARLQHELDVARTSVQQERQLTGQEILRLQQELSDAAASASGASCGALTGGPAAAGTAAADADEVTSAYPLQQGSTCSWHSVHYNPAFEQHKGALTAAATTAAFKAAACAAMAPAAARLDDDQAAHYDARLQDQADTISSLQQQLKQQQQLLASLQRTSLPELRVHDSAASRSSWVDILDLEDDLQQQRPKTAAAAACAAACADAAVQTDDVPTESAGSTAAMAAAGVSTAAGPQDVEQDVLSPHRRPNQPLQQQHGMGPGGASVWCAEEGAAGSALLSAARQEIQRLQELNHQLLQSHAQELKSSVSFDAARRAVSEAKAHTKAKAAALMQASNASWTEKYNTAKAERAAVQAQLQQLQQQHEQLLQQAEAERGHSHVALQGLQLELSAAQQQCQQLQEQLTSILDSHSQELEQMRMDVEAEAAAAILDAGAAAARRSMQQQQHNSQAVQTEPLEQQDAAMQTDAVYDKAGHDLAQELPAQQQPAAAAAGDATARDASQAKLCTSQPLQHLGEQQCQQQQQQGQSAAVAERPSTPQPAAAGPTVGAAAAGSIHSTAAAETAVEMTNSPASAAAAAAAAVSMLGRAGFIHSWHAASVDAAGDDDMCRMSSVSDTPASVCSRLSRINSSSRGTLNLPPLQAAAAEPSGSGTEGSSSTGEYQDCNSGDNCFYNQESGNSSGSCQARPDSASTTAGLPELATAASPVGFTSRIHQHRQQQQQLLADPGLEQQQPDSQASRAAQMTNWQVELMQQQAELDLLKLRLSQQHKQQRLHNVASGIGASSRMSGGRSYVSGLGTLPPAAAAGNRGNASLAAAAAAGAAGFGGSSCAAQRPESPLLPAAGGSSPMTLQQRRQQQQRQQGAAGAAAGATGRSYTGAASRPRQSPGLDQQHNCSSSYVAGLPNTNSQQQQQQHANIGLPAQPAGWQQGVAGTHGRYDIHNCMTPDQFTDTALPITTATRTCPQTDLMYQHACSMAGSAHHTAVGPADIDSGSSSSGGGAGVGLAQLGQDVLGALSLSRYHRERSKEQEARAKQHALNAQDALDRAAAVRITRLSSATATSPGAGAAENSGLSPRYTASAAKQ